MQNVDVAIIGGGMVGLALACSLHGNNLYVAVFEKEPPKITSKNSLQKLRVSAINKASEKLLIKLDIWSEIISQHASCYRGIEIWDKDSFGHISFNTDSIGCSSLGHIVENDLIRHKLWNKAQNYDDISLISSLQIEEAIWRENDVLFILQNGDRLSTRLVVGADGANSWLRDKADIPLTWWNYDHHALVAVIRTTEPHNSVVRQIFHNDGILAFLPLKDPYCCSIVWCLLLEKAYKISNMESKIFNQMICAAFDNRLGLCKLESDRKVFQLTGSYARKFAGHRIALVGDAAHTIHPLLGQGVNLGFMDDAKLVEEILRIHRKGSDIGQYFYLRNYERNRKYSSAIMLAEIQVLYELFSGTNPIKKIIRNVSMSLADKIPGIKLQLMRIIMGLNDLPAWLR